MTESESEADPPPGTDEETLVEGVSTDPTEMVSIVGHFYRGEMERTVGWRTRLDQTTNWAVVLMATILTFTFSSEDNPHYVLLIGVLGILAFLLIESQRYQEYDAWRFRVRLLQRQFLADVTDPDQSSPSDWRERLGEDLRKPTLNISRLAAIAHRLKRVYMLLLTMLIAAWVLRISVFTPDAAWYETAGIGSISGTAVLAVVVGLYFGLAIIALWSIVADRMREFRDDPISEDS